MTEQEKKFKALLNTLTFEQCAEFLEKTEYCPTTDLMICERMEKLDADRFIKFCESY